jgi:hypothetical protein
VEGFCEDGDQPFGPIKCWEVLWLHNWLLKKGSAPSESVVVYRLGLLTTSLTKQQINSAVPRISSTSHTL